MNTPPLASCTFVSVFLAVAAAAGCGGGSTGTGASNILSTEQISMGAGLYEGACAKCHGALGQGTAKAPALVGPKALPLDPPPGAHVRTTQFHTAKDVLDFIRTRMPADRPGSLQEGQYEAILAFALHANGVDLHDMMLTDEDASTFVLH